MPVYRYNAMDPSGRAVAGTLEAESLELVRAKLADLRYHILNIRETRSRSGLSDRFLAMQRVTSWKVLVYGR